MKYLQLTSKPELFNRTITLIATPVPWERKLIEERTMVVAVVDCFCCTSFKGGYLVKYAADWNDSNMQINLQNLLVPAIPNAAGDQLSPWSESQYTDGQRMMMLQMVLVAP